MAFRSRVTVALLGMALVSLTLAATAPLAAVEVGQKAPDFTLTGPDNKPVKLADLTAKGPVVLYTFIQAFTGT
jgi:cytochrome oxidase Cu insertion factor (SCO1/SenC/PrrC family)